MKAVSMTAWSSFARKTAAFAEKLSSVVFDLLTDIHDSYHRELRYARSPARKWRAIHQRVARSRRYRE
jgi:hypothetical protein